MRILVLGAYGYTGSLVCKELDSKALAFDIAGRNMEKLVELKGKYSTIDSCEQVDILQETDVDRIVSQYDIIANCIGPYMETADLLLDRLARSSCLYLDLTGELDFVEQSHQKRHRIAQKHGACILHSIAFESVLSNIMLNKRSKPRTKLKALYHYYDTHGGKASPGTRLTMKLAKYRNNFHIQDEQAIATSEIMKAGHSFSPVDGKSSVPFTLPEISFAQWENQAINIGSFIMISSADVGFIHVSKEPSKDNTERLTILEKHEKRRPKGPSVDQRKGQVFDLWLRMIHEDDRVETLHCCGKDMYYLSAEIMVYFIAAYLGKEQKPSGVLSPSQFLGDSSILSDLNIEMIHA